MAAIHFNDSSNLPNEEVIKTVQDSTSATAKKTNEVFKNHIVELSKNGFLAGGKFYAAYSLGGHEVSWLGGAVGFVHIVQGYRSLQSNIKALHEAKDSDKAKHFSEICKNILQITFGATWDLKYILPLLVPVIGVGAGVAATVCAVAFPIVGIAFFSKNIYDLGCKWSEAKKAAESEGTEFSGLRKFGVPILCSFLGILALSCVLATLIGFTFLPFLMISCILFTIVGVVSIVNLLISLSQEKNAKQPLTSEQRAETSKRLTQLFGPDNEQSPLLKKLA